MPTIIVTGRVAGARTDATWEDGALEATPTVWLRVITAIRAGVYVGEPERGPATLNADAPLPIVAGTIAWAFDEVTDITGVPAGPGLPAGAVG